jgi:predicted nucleic acid-binding protein
LTPFVVDASFAASWFLPDEANPATTALASQAAREAPIVPSLFLHEMRSLFVMAARRGRGSKDHMLQQLDTVEKLYGKHAGAGDGLAIARLAFKHNLTSYDATYLALALDKGLPLATLDKPLAAAAKAEGVTILGPLVAP